MIDGGVVVLATALRIASALSSAARTRWLAEAAPASHPSKWNRERAARKLSDAEMAQSEAWTVNIG